MEAIADAIRTNSTDGRAKGDDRSVSGSSPAVVAIMSIVGTAFLLVGYYAMVAKFCGRGPTRGSLRRGWRAMGRRRIGRLHEEALEMPAAAAAAAHEQGLEPADIEAIPVVAFLKRGRSWKSSCSGGAAPVDCAVCLNEFEEAERLRLLPSCCHAFHLHCIDEWLRSHATCPLCRIPIHLALAIPAPDILSSPSTTGPPTSPLLTAASSHTSPPLIPSPTTTPQHRSPAAVPGGAESLKISQASPLMLAEKETQHLNKGKHKMILGCAKREEPDESCIYHDNNMEGHPSRRPQFAFTRCFSYAGDRPFHGLFKSTTSPTTLLSSSSSCSTSTIQQRQGNQHFGIMQRSSSYSIGSSLLPPPIIIPPQVVSSLGCSSP